MLELPTDAARGFEMMEPALVQVNQLKMYFPIRTGAILKRTTGQIKAVDGISFDIRKGETLGLVGESGCGKSTAGRAILQLYRPTAGEVIFRGIDVARQNAPDIRRARRHMQMIFQDPYASLNPHMPIGEIIARPLRIHRIVSGTTEETRAVAELMAKVGLNPAYRSRYPHEFSGGQRQRIGIARALATAPDFIVCDEPISALDVSIQAQIVNLLERLRDELQLTYLFIAHDLSMVRYISNRIAVMYLGKLMELTSSAELYEQPRHPYTKALLSAIPIPDPPLERKRQRIILQGDLPSPANPPSGCNFSTRCPLAQDVCRRVEPEFREVARDHWAACHFA
jgi:oligopeptide transport system ATP-binding protein